MNHRKKVTFLIIYIVYLIFSWTVFRYFVHFPVAVEELMFKPIIWLSPLWWWRLAQGKNYKLQSGKLKDSLRWGFLGGLTIYLLFRIVMGRPILAEINIEQLAISSAIGIVQGLAFFGGISTLISMVSRNEILNQIVTGIVMGLVQLPVGIFVNKLSPIVLLGTFLITFFIGIIIVNIRLKSKNTLAAIFAYWCFILAVL